MAAEGVGEGDRRAQARTGAAGIDVVDADRHRRPVRRIVDAPFDRVAGELGRRFRRQDLGAAGDVFLERVVLQVDDVVRPGNALLLAERREQRQHDRADRIAERADTLDAVERDAVEELLHIGERADGDTDLADLGGGHGMV